MDKKYLEIDGQQVEFTDEPNLLTVVRRAGIELPTFCYYSELSIYGACRMCVVEDEWGGIQAACSTVPRAGMKIRTNTTKIRRHRKMILELLLSAHCTDCTSCVKNGKCKLQELAARFGIADIRFPKNPKLDNPPAIDRSSRAIVRDPSKCILCGDCVRMCEEVQNVGAIDFARRGAKMTVCPAFDQPLGESHCVGCGQCAAVCPTGALVIHDNTKDVWDVLLDPKKKVVAQVAPAVRVALGEEFGIPQGENVMGLIVAAMRRLGFDEVYDTSMAADLTVMEEAGEFVERLATNPETPLFTSCCPAWVRYVETQHPELLTSVSSCRSPMEMLGSVSRAHEAEHSDGREVVMVAVMPCTAKKEEAARPEFASEAGVPDINAVITTQELAAMIREAGIRFHKLEPEATDMPFGLYSGGGVIFGVTGGVTEAVVRRVAEDKSAGSLKALSYSGIRGMEGSREASVPFKDRTLRIAMVNGLRNAEELIRRMQAGEAHYDFVEVMACPGGCVGGAGQPFSLRRGRERRAQGLYGADKQAQIKTSDANPVVSEMYQGMLRDRSHELLHVHKKQQH